MADWLRLATPWVRRNELFSRVSPIHFAFLCSLLLSFIAIQTSGTLNRDGMFYVETARIFLTEGFGAARASFSWPLLPILMACVSKLTGFGLEASGHLLNALFLAGACSLMVACASRKFPEAVWPICLVVLALPGPNDYREEILREYGCWFFFMLSFWISLRWSETPRWGMALSAQLALVAASLFRPEALTFFPALVVWPLFASPKGERLKRTVMMGGLPVLGLAILAALFLSGQLDSAGRLAQEFNRINFARFDAKAQVLATALIPYAREQAKTLLFLGSISIVPLKFVKQLGIFLVPLLFVLSSPSLRTTLARWQPLAWAFLAHVLVLAVFALDLQFLAGRYVAVLSLLAAPLVGYGLWLLMQRFPRWKHVMLLVAAIIMASNVVSLHPNKQHFTQAGRWLAQNATESPRVYLESPRTAYYAGWRFSKWLLPQDRSLLPQEVAQKRYDLVVLEVSGKEAGITAWLSSIGLHEIQRFSQKTGDAIIIAKPLTEKDQDKAVKTESMREKTGSVE